jgi:hypothetical protein
MDVAYVALGSNLGDRDDHLARARRALSAIPRSRVLAESTIEETAPFGPVLQGAYLNQMVALETELSPRELFAELQRIEREGGALAISDGVPERSTWTSCGSSGKRCTILTSSFRIRRRTSEISGAASLRSFGPSWRAAERVYRHP